MKIYSLIQDIYYFLLELIINPIERSTDYIRELWFVKKTSIVIGRFKLPIKQSLGLVIILVLLNILIYYSISLGVFTPDHEPDPEDGSPVLVLFLMIIFDFYGLVHLLLVVFSTAVERRIAFLDLNDLKFPANLFVYIAQRRHEVASTLIKSGRYLVTIFIFIFQIVVLGKVVEIIFRYCHISWVDLHSIIRYSLVLILFYIWLYSSSCISSWAKIHMLDFIREDRKS